MIYCNSSNPNPNFIPSIRIQFTVEVNNSSEICFIMTEIAKLKINLYAYNIIYISPRKTIFKFVPSNKSSQSIPDLNAVRTLLKKLCINYSEEEVLRVNWENSFTGVFALTVCVISSVVTIYNSYVAEDGTLVFETSSTCKACNTLLEYK